MALERYRVKGRLPQRSDEWRTWHYNKDGSPKFDAFSHSEQCDKLLETLDEEKHVNCGCRCHVLRLNLDLDIAPDFVNEIADAQAFEAESADAAVEVPFTPFEESAAVVAIREDEPPPVLADEPDDPLCDSCDAPVSKCDCVTYDDEARVFKNRRGEVVICEGAS